MAPHSNTLAWKIPWMEEPGRLQSMGSLRVGHDWTTSLSFFTFLHWRRKWLPHPWDSPGKNTGVGCHFLLQCMKVKSESEVAQSCPTPSDPMDYSLPCSSIHEIFQARVLEWGAIAFSNLSHLTYPIYLLTLSPNLVLCSPHLKKHQNSELLKFQAWFKRSNFLLVWFSLLCISYIFNYFCSYLYVLFYFRRFVLLFYIAPRWFLSFISYFLSV